MSAVPSTSGTPQSRSSSRSSKTPHLRTLIPDRDFGGATLSLSPSSHPALQLPTLASPSSHARPSHADVPAAGRGGGTSITSRSQPRVQSPNTRSGPYVRVHGATPTSAPRRRSVGSPSTRSTAQTTTLDDSGHQWPQSSTLRSSFRPSSVHGRSRRSEPGERGRRGHGHGGGGLGTSTGGGRGGSPGAARVMSSSPPYSALASSGSGSAAVAWASAPMPTGVSSAMLRGAGVGALPPDASPTACVGVSPTSPVPAAPGASSAATAAPVSFKECCSHCKIEDGPLYCCPCGLARYCSTTCQQAHWQVHRIVCGNAVRAIEPAWWRCDWCRKSSQTLRKCGCGLAYYCDVHCQRADWSYHCLACSTVTSEALATALLGGPAPRTTREVATQTAHWQINIPVLPSNGRGEGVMESSGRGGAGGNAGSQAVLNTTESDSVGELHSEDGPFGGAASFPRGMRARSPWDYGSQPPDNSISAPLGLSNTFGTTAAASAAAATMNSGGHHDPNYRMSRSYGSVLVTPRTPSSRHPSHHHHHRTTSLYNSLHVTTTLSNDPAEPLALQHHRHGGESEMSPISTTTAHNNGYSFATSAAMSSFAVGGGGSVKGHGYAVNEIDVGPLIPSSSASPMSPSSAIRDQPAFMALATTSRRIVEDEEAKERAVLFRQFRLVHSSAGLKMLTKQEEEQRMAILKEEVMWCVLTGNPTAKRLKQQLLRQSTR